MKSKIVYILLLCLSPLFSKMTYYKLLPDRQQSQTCMNIKILDMKELDFEDKNGVEFSEVSGLAYKNNKLFALSDRGYLYKFDISIKNNKIDKLVMLKALKLKNKKAKLLKKKKRDSEGLAFFGKDLLISFERKHRVDLYNKNAIKIKKIKINKILTNRDNFAKPNKGLESVTYSSRYGIITAPERPLRYKNNKFHTIYAKNRSWKFEYDSSITSLEFMSEDMIMILLRKFNNLTRREITTLLSINLNKCKNTLCTFKTLAVFDSLKGYHTDNFEGLTKISKNRYLMISDDNGSFFQKTLLVLFEVIN